MKKNSPAYVILFMVVITLICGAAISFVQSSMKRTLEANDRLAKNRMIASAFGLEVAGSTADAYSAALLQNLTSDTLRGDGAPVEMFTMKSGSEAVGFIFTGMGFWDNITGIVVLSKDLEKVQALRIIDQKETPGLGARITEETFTNQFVGYPLSWQSGSNKPFSFGEIKGENRRIDALTGATQTSLALERMLNSSLNRFKKLYAARTEVVTRLAQAGGN